MATSDTSPASPCVTQRRLTVHHQDFHITTRWELWGGRYEPFELTIRAESGEPLLAEDIRRLPLGSVLAADRTEVAREHTPHLLMFDLGTEKVAAVRSGPHTGTPLSGDELAEVATVYRTAYSAGRPVTADVASHFGISKPTASKRIMAARRAGLLDGVGRAR